jgi:uncharacterized protein YukE
MAGGGELEVTPETLRAAARELTQAGQRLQADWQALAGQVQGMGQLFGADMVSSLIAATYQAAQQIANDCLTSAAEGFTGFGGGLEQMAGTFQDAETATTESVEGVI